MTARYEELAARIGSVKQLGAVVGALRGIAAANVQRGESLLDGVREYAETIARAIAQALALHPSAAEPGGDGDGAELLLLFCAEQGFAGAFSQRVFEIARARARGARLLVIGRRGLRMAASLGLKPAWGTPGIVHVASAAGLADRIAQELSRRLGAGSAGRVGMIYMRPVQGGQVDAEEASLFPLDLRRFGRVLGRPPPLLQLPPAELLQRLAVEYLRAQLTAAALHSFAAENTARMAAMSAARDNINRKLDTLQREARISRQEAVTGEVIELAAGAFQPGGAGTA